MLALLIPTAWMAKLKSRPSVAGRSIIRTSTGKPTVPPPMGTRSVRSGRLNDVAPSPAPNEMPMAANSSA